MTSENNKKMDLEVTPEHREKEEQQKDLLKFAGTSITCCVSIIDIVDSTKTTSKIPENTDLKIQTFFFSVSIFYNVCFFQECSRQIYFLRRRTYVCVLRRIHVQLNIKFITTSTLKCVLPRHCAALAKYSKTLAKFTCPY